MDDHTHNIGGMDTPETQHVFSKDRKVSLNTICNTLEILNCKRKEGQLKYIFDVFVGDTRNVS
jgi:hypothetical protein